MENEINDIDKQIDEVHATLSHTSVELSSLFWHMDRETQLKRPSSGGWSPLQILIHLKQVAEIFAERVKRMTKREGEQLIFLKDYDENKLLARVHLEDETVKNNLNEFMIARSELLNRVSLIDKSEWKIKMANHEVLGEITLLELLIPLAEREKKFIQMLNDILEPEKEEEEEFTIDTVHATLSHTTIELNQLFWEVPKDELLEIKGNEEMCPLAKLIQLRIIGEIYAERTKRVMKHLEDKDLIFLKDYNIDKQMSKIDLSEESSRGNLTAFMHARSELLNEISLIDPEIWLRKVALHETRGEVTLLELLSPLAAREKICIEELKERLSEYY